MIKILKQPNNNFLTLKAIFDVPTATSLIQKNDGGITLIDSEKTIFIYFKEKKMTFKKLYQSIRDFCKVNSYDLNIDLKSFTTTDFDEAAVFEAVSEAIIYHQHDMISYQKKAALTKNNYCLITDNFDDSNLELIKIKMASVNLTRDLQDTPPNLMYPEAFVKTITPHFNGLENITIKVLDKAAIAEHNMGLLLSVAAGSHNEPRVLVIEYNGARSDSEKIGLVGKGITFDSGGYSLKPSASLINMKFDMSGSAIVCSTLLALAKLKAKVNVVAVACLTENRIGGHATLVETVAVSMNSKTVEILNTDAEGRLVLADGITYAIRNANATKIIDVATLTGAITIALGKHATGAFSNNDEFYNEFTHATKLSNELVWRMPILPENIAEMKCSEVADLANIAKNREMGSSQAAGFLQEFVEDLPFIHLDIAGTANDKSRGTGVMVKTLIAMLNR